MSRNVCAIRIRSSKSSVNSSSFVFNSFNFSTNVQSIHEINSTTNKEHALGGIRGGQPIYLKNYIYKKIKYLNTNHVHHKVNHY